MDYAKHYEALINRARNRRLRYRYVEKHHVIPRCIGGIDHPNNIVRLTPEEHYVAHQLLVKMYPRKWKLLYAARAMTMESRTHGGGRSANKLYGWIKRRISAHMVSESRKRRSGKKYGPKDIRKLAAILAPKQISA